jgi:2-polyprenyl-6-hydroxyphenyl methylase/3-demethylubiquinone-9 3-methyltransferase
MRDPLDEAKRRLRSAWSSAAGYHQLTEPFVPAIEALLDWVGVGSGDVVLDVATGTGRAALAARRRGAQVTALDFSPVQLGEAAHYAERAGFDDIHFDEGDAEELPYAKGSFNIVLSTFGALHAPRADVVAGELDRVLAPGGRLGLTTWLPDSSILTLVRLLGPYSPTSPLVIDPREWGRPVRLREFFSRRYLPDLEHREDELVLIYPDVTTAWREWHNRYGPIRAVYTSLNAERRAQLDQEALDYFSAFELADGRVIWRVGYLLTRATKLTSTSRLG